MISSISACNKDHEYRKLIIGEWKFYKSIDLEKEKTKTNGIQLADPPDLSEKLEGYSFSENGNCEYKEGYIDRYQYNDKNIYLGRNTQYKIENDSLIIYDLIEKRWKGRKIISLKKDTLLLKKDDSKIEKYLKMNYQINYEYSFDELVVSTSGCYGTCPVLSININKNGMVYIDADRYNTIEGHFIANASNSIFERIQLDFLKARYYELEDNYAANWNDMETITISFIKNGRIVKTIIDYGRQGPAELNWAYTYVRYLYQSLNLEKWKKATDVNFIFNHDLEKGDSTLWLNESESFYLFKELQTKPKSTTRFNPIYKIKYRNGKDETKIMQSDGRYFKLADHSTTIDIGYNFFKDNKLTEKFRKVNYEF